MLFYVHAYDNPGVGADLERLGEDHWSYMDKFSDRLVLRGPTLSGDGTEHTGSVHVVDLPDRAAAEDFATAEPFQRAGLYREVTVRRARLVRRGEIPANDAGPTALVTARWADEAPVAITDVPRSLVFLATLLSDDASATDGLLAVTTTPTTGAEAAVRPVATELHGPSVPLTVHNWQRGGRR